VAVHGVIDGTPRIFLIDTGVDPSAVDLAVARDHSLEKTGEHGEVDGVGNNGATAYPSVLPEITIGDRRFGPIDVLVIDMSKLSARYGAPLDGILGYSLLKDHAILIDYAVDEITFFDGAAGSEPARCTKAYRFPLKFASDDDHSILVPGLTVGGVEIPAFVDTGSSNGLRIDVDSPAVAEILAALPKGRESTTIGARGEASQRLASLPMSVKIGPFTLQGAEAAMVHGATAPIGIGNRFFEALGAKLLIDIPGGEVGIFQSCK